MLLNATKFAERAGVSRQAVSKLCSKGALMRRADGWIDTDHPINADYLYKKEQEKKQAVVDAINEPSLPKPKRRAPKKSKPNPKRIKPPQNDPYDEDLTGDVNQLSNHSLGRLKTIEQIRKLELETEIKRGSFVDKDIIRTLFARIYEIHMNEFLTTKDKLVPDLASIFGTSDQAKISKAANKIDELLWGSLEHIKYEINRFLNEIKTEEL